MKLAQPQIPPKKRIVPARAWRKGGARFPSDGGAGFLIGGFAQKMFELRSKNTAKIDISQDKLSKLADIAYNVIIKIDSGATLNPTIEAMAKIAKALEVGVDDLMK